MCPGVFEAPFYSLEDAHIIGLSVAGVSWNLMHAALGSVEYFWLSFTRRGDLRQMGIQHVRELQLKEHPSAEVERLR